LKLFVKKNLSYIALHERFRTWSEQAYNINIKIMKKVEEYARRRGKIKREFTEMQMSLPFDLNGKSSVSPP